MEPKYISPILEHQRVYDTIDKRLYHDVSVIHVYQKDGVYWGCFHETHRSVLTRQIPRGFTRSELIVGGGENDQDIIIRHAQSKLEKTYIPVSTESRYWMSVHRSSEFDTWVKDFGTDDTYEKDLRSLGVMDSEFRFTRGNRQVGERVNPIPETPVTPRRNERYVHVPVRMTPSRLLIQLADGWTADMNPWFGTKESYQSALDTLAKQYPPKKKSKSKCGVPFMTGQALGYDQESQSKSHMRMGWYIKVLG